MFQSMAFGMTKSFITTHHMTTNVFFSAHTFPFVPIQYMTTRRHHLMSVTYISVFNTYINKWILVHCIKVPRFFNGLNTTDKNIGSTELQENMY